MDIAQVCIHNGTLSVFAADAIAIEDDLIDPDVPGIIGVGNRSVRLVPPHRPGLQLGGVGQVATTVVLPVKRRSLLAVQPHSRFVLCQVVEPLHADVSDGRASPAVTPASTAEAIASIGPGATSGSISAGPGIDEAHPSATTASDIGLQKRENAVTE